MSTQRRGLKTSPEENVGCFFAVGLLSMLGIIPCLQSLRLKKWFIGQNILVEYFLKYTVCQQQQTKGRLYLGLSDLQLLYK